MKTKNHWQERLLYDDYAGNFYHVSRYQFASQITNGLKVLDIACGAGFGSELLLTQGSSGVIGADINNDCNYIELMRTNQRLVFVNADALNLPFADNSFEAIVCMETIEHVTDDKGMLVEFQRVLNEDGILVISTPNALVTKPINGEPQNPFHVREYTPDEFVDLLSEKLEVEAIYGQRVKGTTFLRNDSKRQRSWRRVFRGSLDAIPISWRLAFPSLLPPKTADRIVTSVTGHNYHLTVEDFEFGQDNFEDSSVLVALCHA